MKIVFKDKSFVDCQKSENGSVFITIGARDHLDSTQKTTNIVELTIEEFKKLISDVQ